MSTCACNTQTNPRSTLNLTTLASLRAALASHETAALVFSYEGVDIQSGYHVTEVKSLRIASLDCGAQGEERTETVIQLWDVPEDGKTHMAVGKFFSIIDKVAARVGLDEDAPLVFEVSRPGEAMRLYFGGTLKAEAKQLTFALAPYSATCKPAVAAMQALGALLANVPASCC